MESKFFVALVALCAFCSVSAHFVIVPAGFGNTNNPEVMDYLFGMCEERCSHIRGGFARCAYTHPNACNLYVQCLRFGTVARREENRNVWVIHGRVAPEGLLYNEKEETIASAFLPPNIPNIKVCEGIGHPCETNKSIPVTAGQCGGYKSCENNTMVNYQCPGGKGFSAWTGNCDLDCVQGKRRVVQTKCGPSIKGKLYHWINDTVVYGDNGAPEVEPHEVQCPAFTSYQKIGNCTCERYEVTVKPCETISVLHFSSSDNSWELAKNNTPINGGATLTGSAIVVSPEERRFGRSGFFEGGSRFISHRLNGNDLGLYFDLSLTFQATEEGNSNGITVRSDDKIPILIALADNSADDKEATYGCMLRVEQTNIGKVVCYVQPSKVTGDTGRNDVTVESPEVDLTKRISVQFAKDDTRGKLTVTAEGSPEQVTNVRFPQGVRAVGQTAPWIIADGTGKRPFRGYIDDMDLRKYCSHFM